MRTNVIDSTDLLSYNLSKPVREKLQKWDKLVEYNQLACNPPFEAVRLFNDDYHAIARAIVAQSDKRRSIMDVTYRGLPIISVGSVVPPK